MRALAELDDAAAAPAAGSGLAFLRWHLAELAEQCLKAQGEAGVETPAGRREFHEKRGMRRLAEKLAGETFGLADKLRELATKLENR